MSRGWYLSFAGDEGFRGAIFVRGAPSFAEAVVTARATGISPGGECAGHSIPDEVEVPDAAWNRLLSLDDLRSLGFDPQPLPDELYDSLRCEVCGEPAGHGKCSH